MFCSPTNAVTGSLLAVAERDRNLSEYGAIIVDEAHNHTVQSDLLLGLLRHLAVSRKSDLKIIIMSATINAKTFLEFFQDAAPVEQQVPGRTYDVSVSYLPEPPQDYTDLSPEIVELVFQTHLIEPSGNILVFCPGAPEIGKVLRRLEKELSGPNPRFTEDDIGPLECYPLYSALPDELQDLAINSVAPPPRNGHIGRKVIVATNIAEASVTLLGVTVVIDTCLVKIRTFNPNTESEALILAFVSKQQADQRAGRAGRMRDGKCFRLCTERGFNEQITDESVALMQQSDMLDPVLSIRKLGSNPADWPFIKDPATESIAKAYGMLHRMGVLDWVGEMTPHGDQMARLPIEINLAFMLIEGSRCKVADEMLSIVAMLEATDAGKNLWIDMTNASHEEKVQLFKIRKHFTYPGSDHITFFNIYMSWRRESLKGEDAAKAFIKDNKLQGAVLMSADVVRDRLLKALYGSGASAGKSIWRPSCLQPNEPGFYNHILMALAASNVMRVAKRDPTHEDIFTTQRCNVPAKISLSSVARGTKSDFVVYHALSGINEHFQLKVVTAIPAEIIVKSQPAIWCDVQTLTGHVQDGFAAALRKITGLSDKEIRGGMPPKSSS